MWKFFAGMVLALIAVVAMHKVLLSPRAYLEHRACLSVRPSMSEQVVLQRMGEPQEQLDRSPDERALYYRWLFNSSGPIYVVLGKGANGYAVRYTECESSG